MRSNPPENRNDLASRRTGGSAGSTLPGLAAEALERCDLVATFTEGVRYRVPFLGSMAVCRRFDRRLLEEHELAVTADPLLSDLLGEAVSASGHVPHRLVSGAGHDAAVMAAAAPIAMPFLRSPGGVSHHADERVLPEDVVVALDVLVRYLELLAGRSAPAGGLTDQSHPRGDA
jgi:acetylornithine deacetylase/succinyl-diaminopimelate desuccinylase-like protein